MAHLEKNSSQAVSKWASTIDQIADSAHNAVDRLTEGARPTVLRGASNARHLMEGISGTTDRVEEQLEKTVTRLKDAEQQLAGVSRSYFREHPLTATGIALAAGFLVGQLHAWYRAGKAESAEDGVTRVADKR